MKKISYPIILDKIFEKLNNYSIKPIIIGGFIRDQLLEIESKDIDIELYNVKNIDFLENILKEFGTLNEVGKSFSVIKLCIADLELDFSLPRTDSKIASGHRGFKVTANTNLDFKTASSRRDFTINAIGYDVQEQKILDPFGGIEDLYNKRLKAVELKKFGEDPLRVFRAIQFASRFDLQIDEKLLIRCQTMVDQEELSSLSKERIFTEMQKLLLKSATPSSGFILIKQLGLFKMFTELGKLSIEEFERTISLLDRYKDGNTPQNKQTLITMLTLLTSLFKHKDILSFLHRLSDDKEILRKVTNTHNFIRSPSYTLAMRIDSAILKEYLHITGMQDYKEFIENLEPKVKGKDLIAQGLKPSKEFALILEQKYQEQIKKYLM